MKYALRFDIAEFVILLFLGTACMSVLADDGRHVVVFEHSKFGGKSQSLKPGVYRADQDRLNEVGNDAISSLKVPFGFMVDVFDNEADGNGSGTRMTLGPGDHEFVGDGVNDKISLIVVYGYMSFYHTSDDEQSPLRVALFEGGAVLHISYRSGMREKVIVIDMPDNMVVDRIDEATKAGDATWSHSIDGNKLSVHLNVRNRQSGTRNWVGVHVYFRPK